MRPEANRAPRRVIAAAGVGKHKCHELRGTDPDSLTGAAPRYFRLLRRFAQACATDESTLSLPGSVAHPPFSTNVPCWYELTFLNSARFVPASALRWNLSTQIGDSAATTATFVLCCVISLAV